MDTLQVLSLVIGITVGFSIIVGGLLSMWLKGKLSDLTVAIKVLTETVRHYSEVQKSLCNTVNRLEDYSQRNRERIILVESRAESAHNRLDDLDKRSPDRKN